MVEVQTKQFPNTILRCYRYPNPFDVKATNQNVIHQRFMRILNPGNAYCHSVQNGFSYHLLSENIMVKIYDAINFLLFTCVWKTDLSQQGKNKDSGCFRTGC
jgi:hypothetical protein